MALQNALGVSPLVTTLGGTGTATTFTAGSLVFAGASGVYTQDNTNLSWNNTTKRLSIGGPSVPANTLTVNGASYFSQEVTIASGGLAIASGTILHFASLSTGVLHSSSLGIISSTTVNLSSGSTDISGVLVGANGGTGVANTGLTITLSSGGTGKVLSSDVSGNATWAALSGLGVTSITGTANQVIASASIGSVTLSTPQNIGTSSDVAFGSIVLSTSGIPISSYTSASSTTPFGSTGQFNLSSKNTDATNNNWQMIVFSDHLGNLSGGIGFQIENQTTGISNLNFYNKSSGGLINNNLSIANTGVITLAQPLPATSGGSGFASYAVGDILYASSTTALSKLADVATGNALISGGVTTAPSWGKIGLTTHVSGTLGVGNGGTGTATTFTAGSVVFAGSSGIYTQDNTNLFWDDSNNRLGIGTASPSFALHVSSATTVLPTIEIENTNGDATSGNLKFFKNGGSAAANDNLGIINFSGQNSTPAEVTYADITAISTTVTAGAIVSAISARTAIAGSLTETLRISAGNVTSPQTSRFSVNLTTTTRTTVTGDSTAYLIVFDTVAYNIGSNFDATGFSLYTAPLTGKYVFHAGIWFGSLGAGHTLGEMYLYINSAARNYGLRGNYANMRDSGNALLAVGSWAVALTAGDTVGLRCAVNNSTKTVDILASASILTYFMGELIG